METRSDSRWLIVACLYALTAAWGVVQVGAPSNGLAYLLFSLAIAFSATMWAVVDSRRVGQPLLHITQFVMFLTWPIAVPAYLIWSRGWRGLGLALLHAVGLTITLGIFFYLSVFLVNSTGLSGATV